MMGRNRRNSLIDMVVIKENGENKVRWWAY